MRTAQRSPLIWLAPAIAAGAALLFLKWIERFSLVAAMAVGALLLAATVGRLVVIALRR